MNKNTGLSQQVPISQAQQNSEQQVNVEPAVSRNCTQNKSVEEAPAEPENDCVTRPKNPPNDCTKAHANQPSSCCHVNPAQTFSSSSLLGNPIFNIKQFSPEAILAQQLASFGRNPFTSPNFPVQFSGGIGFPTGQNFPGFSPYISRGLIQGFPSTPRATFQQRPAFGQFTPPHVPFHQTGNKTWPIQQRIGGLPRASPFHSQSSPRPPSTRSFIHKNIDPRQLAPVFSTVDTGKTRQTTSNASNSNNEIRDEEKLSVANVTTLNPKPPNDSKSVESSDVKSLETEGTAHNSDDSFGTRDLLVSDDYMHTLFMTPLWGFSVVKYIIAIKIRANF